MSKTTEITVTVYNVKRGPVSTMGNPSYIFNTNQGPYRTQSNNGAAYALENDFPINETLDREITLTITPAGRVITWKA